MRIPGHSEMKNLLCLMFLGLIVGIIPAQEKPKSIPIDEFNVLKGDLDSLIGKTHDFAKRLSTEAVGSRGVIIVHPGIRRKEHCADGSILEDLSVDQLVRKVMSVHSELRPEQLVILRGRTLLTDLVYFWIVPNGAEDPKPTDFDVNFGCCCVGLSIIGRDIARIGTKRLDYAVHAPSLKPSAKREWRVSQGKIVSGQGTDAITIELSDKNVNEVKVSFITDNVNPLCNCPYTFEFTTVLKEK